MKGKNIAFLVLPAFIYGLFLFIAPMATAKAGTITEEGWVDTSVCTASECGTTEGTKTQDYYSKVCEKDCPEDTFTASHEVVDVEGHYIYANKVVDVPGHYTCPNNYTEGWTAGGWHYCEKDSNHVKYDFNDKKIWIDTTYICPVGYEKNPGHSNCRQWVPDTYKTETFSVTFKYDKAPSDKNHCHKPTPESLDIPSWARDDYGKLQIELDSVDTTDCHFEVTDSRTVSCTAKSITCEEICPTECDLPASQVADGKGGLKDCPATVACEEPEMCKWDDKLEADDPECPKDCEYDSTISEDDPLCAPIDDDEDVKGETDTKVVLGATGPGDNLDIYLVELLLVAISIASYVFFSKKYLKNSR